MSILIFGLTNYYGRIADKDDNNGHERIVDETKNKIRPHQDKSSPSLQNILFACIYIVLIIVASQPYQTQEIFIRWDQLTVFQIMRLVVAIALSFFAPGYGIVAILDRKHELGSLPRFLIAYLLSMLITGLCGYTAGSTGFAISNINLSLCAIHALILACFIFTTIKIKKFPIKSSLLILYNKYNNKYNIIEPLRKNISEVTIFGSLFALVVLSTYYLYDGTIIGDEWFQHGQALSFLHGTFKDFAIRGWNIPYPFFQHAFLATYFALSNIPSLNAYVAINFVNIIPVFAFYYFFSKWLPQRKRVALLASTLFMLSSGFGWAYLLNLEANSNDTSIMSAIGNIQTAGTKTFDILTSNTFIDVGGPTITTGLIMMGLPAGFVLLGLIKENIKCNFSYIVIVASICILGFLSHDEFALFIIIASIIPLIFRLPKNDSLFIAMSVALSLISFLVTLSPDDYYRTKSILGVTFVILFLVLVIVTWLIYSNKLLCKIQNLKPVLFTTSISTAIAKQIFTKKRSRFIFAIVLFSAVSYLYILSFIIWDVQNSIFNSSINTNFLNTVPLYFYPLRFGVTGILGLCFILSYVLKKFEKEVFVFGIIAIVAILVGPFYNEQRLNKYVMSSMAVFASLALYKILTPERPDGQQHYQQKQQQRQKKQSRKKPLIIGLAIGLIITSSSLSVVMYASLMSMAISVGARWFPSDSLFRLLEFFRKNVNPTTYSIAIPNDEVNPLSSLLAQKIHGFLGLPYGKLVQSSLSLRESTLEGFYSILNQTNTKFIVLSKQDSNGNNGLDRSTVLDFALENFKKVYENENYIVLSVPSLAPPSSSSASSSVSAEGVPGGAGRDVALVSRANSANNNGISVLSTTLVDSLPSMGTTKIEGNKISWSNDINVKQNVNYIEGKFRIISENSSDSHAGIVWSDGNKDYYAFIRPSISRLSIYSPDKGELLSTSIDRPVLKNNWYTVKIVYTSYAINVFLDDALKAHISKFSNNANISKVGIRTYNTAAEFEPLKTGTALMYNYYYSVSTLALSKIKYDIFAEGDYSAFSKNNIILPFDPIDTNSYLKFVSTGGTVIVLNADNSDFKGGFKNLLCINPGRDVTFDGISSSDEQQHLKLSGTAAGIEVSCLGPVVTSYYINNSTKQVTPFTIEKQYGKGKIVFVNVYGYFGAVSANSDEFLKTLKNIPSLVSLNADKYTNAKLDLNTIPETRFFGNLEMSGEGQQPVTVSSSSLLFPRNSKLNIENIIAKENNFHNLSISNLNLSGAYNVVVNSANLSYMPSLSSSSSVPPFSYVKLGIPLESNMTVKLFPGSKAEFSDDISGRRFEINSSATDEIRIIGMKGVGSNTAQPSIIPFLIKTPEISVNGKTNFQQLHSNNPNNPNKPWTDNVRVQIDGKTMLKLQHTTNDVENRTQFITYFNWNSITKFDPSLKLAPQSVGFPLGIPWRDVLTSGINIQVIMTILLIDVILVYIRSREKINMQFIKKRVLYPTLREIMAKVSRGKKKYFR